MTDIKKHFDSISDAADYLLDILYENERNLSDANRAIANRSFRLSWGVKTQKAVSPRTAFLFYSITAFMRRTPAELDSSFLILK